MLFTIKPPQTQGGLEVLSDSLSYSRCISFFWPQYGTLQIEMWPLSWQFWSFCCNILSQYWSVMWDSYCLIATHSLYLDFMMNPIRDKPITHAHQWRDSATVWHSGVWEELSLKSEDDWNESSLLPTPCFFIRSLSQRCPLCGWSSSHLWDWHQHSHRITLRGIWKGTAIKWSAAVK